MRLEAVGAGPRIVHLAALAGGTGLFREEAGAVARAGYRVALLDNTGDRGDDAAGIPESWDPWVDEVERAVTAEGDERAILWGASYGAILALVAASRLPHRIGGLLLCFPPDPSWCPRPYRALLEGLDPERMPGTARFVATGVLGVLCAWEAVYPTTWIRAPRLAAAALDAATPGTTIVGKLRLLWGEAPFDPALVEAPTRVVAGSLDTVAPLAGARRLARSIGCPQPAVIRYAGHGGHYSRPRRYREACLEALGALADDPARGTARAEAGRATRRGAAESLSGPRGPSGAGTSR